ncbi:hypothetical protein NDU88_007975 [Pleurodeles waltl]|uniref:Uncharacterized protein n=1 Tax=Pleurodeles waltl TaxID=8319 RepID=A0AAV7VTT6_PLEWA|nr:hypothetical protein NDU88_007975 [Pleurodeles waltl]
MEPELQVLPILVYLLFYQEQQRRRRRPSFGPVSAVQIDALPSRGEKKLCTPSRLKEKLRIIPLMSDIDTLQALFDTHLPVRVFF